MDTETRNYLQMHTSAMAQKALEGDLLSRAILNLFYQYRAGKSSHEALKLLKEKVTVYRKRVERELGVKP